MPSTDVIAPSIEPTIKALDSADQGAGIVLSPATALEERWIFARAGSEAKAAGDLVLTGALLGAKNHPNGNRETGQEE